MSTVSESKRIVITGLTNAGKSSLFNRLFGKELAIVSGNPGTTTDPVSRKLELIGAGPCVVTDTAGLGDEGELSGLRLSKTFEVLKKADLCLFVTRADEGFRNEEQKLIDFMKENKLPFITVLTFTDQKNENIIEEKKKNAVSYGSSAFYEICNKSPDVKIEELYSLMEEVLKNTETEPSVLEGIVKENDLVLLVTPCDLSAPKGRLILPQVETIRDALDKHASALVVTEKELPALYRSLGRKPELVVTDSQAFKEVAAVIDRDQKLTSFSILFARKKAELSYMLKSLRVLEAMKKDGKVLILEACNHHIQKDDIGSVKIPFLLRKKISENLVIENLKELPENIEVYDLVIHCGACMLTRKEMLLREEIFKHKNIPLVNYGLFLAWANGLFPRAVEVLGEKKTSIDQ